MLYNVHMKKYLIMIICGLILLAGIFKCPVYETIGIPCPTCGITRAYKLFLTGHIKDAFMMHPLFLLPAVFLFRPFRSKRILAGVIIVFIAVYIIRFRQLFPAAEPFNFNYNSTLGEFLK